MMKFLKKLDLRHSDASDQQPSTPAVRLSWVVVILVLLGWGIYDLVTEGALNAPMIVLSLGLAVFWTGRLILRAQQKNDS